MSKLTQLEDCVVNTGIVTLEVLEETLRLLGEYKPIYEEFVKIKKENDDDSMEMLRHSLDLLHLMFEKGSDLYTPIILSLLDKDYKAVYWSPAWAPTKFSFSEHGQWTFVDKVNLKKGGLESFESFTKPKFVRFDITKTPDFPKSIKKGIYDLTFFNLDWAGGGSTYKAADLVLKKGGLLMTHQANLESFEKTVGKKYSLIFKPTIGYDDYEGHHSYALLKKERN